MAGKVGDLFVQIGGDTSGLSASLGNAFKSVSSFGARIASTAIGTALPGMIASVVSGIASQFSGAITNASDLNETLSKTDVLLGGNAERVKEFAKGMANSGAAGMNDTLNSVTSIVTAMTNLGTSTDTATDKAMQLQQRFADLASQDNKSIAEVQAAYQSLLAGEIEPMRKLNVFTSIEQLRKSGKPLGEAAYDAFMSQTRRASGDLSRTSMSLANLSRSGDIKSGMISESIGQALQGAAQAFQLFRSEFLSQILAKVQDGSLARAGESIFNAVVSIGTVLQSAMPFLLETVFGFVESLSKMFAEISIAISAAFKKPMDFVGLVLRSVADTILSIYQYFTSIPALLAGGSGSSRNSVIQGLRDKLQEGMVDNQTSLAEAGVPTVERIEETKRKLSAAIATPTMPGGPSGGSVASEAGARTTSFTGLLDGVVGKAQEKQTALLEQINGGIQKLAGNTKQSGATSVVEKPTLATIVNPIAKSNQGWAAWGAV